MCYVIGVASSGLVTFVFLSLSEELSSSFFAEIRFLLFSAVGNSRRHRTWFNYLRFYGIREAGRGSVAPNAVLPSVLYHAFGHFTIKIPHLILKNKLATAFQ